MDTSLFIVAQLELVMITVPLASKLAPSITFERLVCHQDVTFVICVTPQDVTSILLLAGHHLYSWPESVLNVEFAIKKARVGASDSEGEGEEIAAANATWADEAAWATDISSLVLVFCPVGRGGE